MHRTVLTIEDERERGKKTIDGHVGPVNGVSRIVEPGKKRKGPSRVL